MSQDTFKPDPDKLALLIERDAATTLADVLKEMEPADRSLAVSRLETETRARLLEILSPEDAATIFRPMPEDQARESLELLPPDGAARILEQLPSAMQADALDTVEARTAEAILGEMAPEAASELRALCAYESDEAGGVMITEYLEARDEQTVGEFVDDLQRNAELYRNYEVQYAYVVDTRERLRGVLVMRDLLLSPRGKRIADLAHRDPLRLDHHARLPELQAFFAEYTLVGVPIVNENDQLLGVVRRTDVQEAVARENVGIYLESQGIIGGEELRSMPLPLRTRRRLSWLSINIVLNFIAASVIAWKRDVLEELIALAVFLPIISDMSGCSGNQAVAVSIRELTLGLVRPNELARVLSKEVLLGLLNGVILGALIGIAAGLYGSNPWLGCVVGGALAVNTVIAVTVGGSIPLLLKRCGRDPALASGPILTTVTDMCGFFLTLSLAAWAMPLLR